jgi:hypothetical protein
MGIPLAPDSILVAITEDSNDWTQPYVTYLECKIFPKDKAEARMIVRRCKSFVPINNELYKRSVTGIFQRCISPEEGRKILYDTHVRDCGHHIISRLLVAKALQHGFYWLTAHADAIDIVQRCVECQKYAN